MNGQLHTFASRVFALFGLITVLSTFGCGGGGSPVNNAPPTTYTVGGTVAGLAGTGLVLQNNGGNNLSVTANGSFTFTAALASGAAYNVTVSTQPSNPTQTCAVTSGTGTVSSNVTSVAVACTTNTYTVGGTVSGLSGSGLVLQDNGGNNLAVTANGSFTFTTAINSGTAYSVAVLTQPSDVSQTCVASSNSGTVTSSDVTSVAVACTTDTFTVGGTVSGLAGTGLVLQDNGGNNLAVTANGSFTFTTAIASGAAYNVTVLTEPSALSQTCVPSLNTGTVTNKNINNVAVVCTTDTFTVGGTVSGLTGTGLVLQDNGGNNLAVSASGPFTFTTALASGTAYSVTVFSQPSTQSCSVTNGTGTVTGAAVNTVAVSCAASPFTALTATMTIARAGHTATLLPNGMVLITGGINSLTPPPVFNSAELYNPTTQTFTTLTATMASTRYDHTATLLPTGQVLLTGGVNSSGSVLDTAELYDPVANTFTALTATMTSARRGHTATLLPKGQVLITGGVDNTLYTAALDTAEIYDPTAQTFTALTSTMVTALVYHTATLLPSGQVLLAGGEEGNGYGTALNTAELYNPTANTFTALSATMTTARFSHTATLLPTGEVLLAGGSMNGTGGSGGQGTVLNSAELYDPTANTFTALAATVTSTHELDGATFHPAVTALVATLTAARELAAAALLPNGQVLITGGFSATGTALNTGEVYEALPPSVQTFTALSPSLPSAVVGHSATRLPNGKILLAGGFNASETVLNTAQLYDPVANAFTAVAAKMTTARGGHAATLLPNGLVLITGGATTAQGSPTLDSAELYDPVANTFTALSATMTSARSGHTATLLPNGLVLITGGFTDTITALNTAEVYNPTTQAFTALSATMVSTRGGHTATLLPTGMVLLAGGFNDSDTNLNTAEIYNPTAGTFTALTATMTSSRDQHTATLLPNGLVLLAGGSTSAHGDPALNTAELYDPVAGTFTATTNTMTTAREFDAAALLPNGTVLLTGGATNPFPTIIGTVEVYQP
ncbi:MAG: kelch repeat-containing protein [Terriglobia bacterium]